MNAVNVVISIAGAALNFWLLAQDAKPMFAFLAVILTLRAVYYGSRMRRAQLEKAGGRIQ